MTGIQRIAAERTRQIEDEKWSTSHDDAHTMGEMIDAAQCYACVASAETRGSCAKEWPASMFNGFCDSLIEWPWDEKWYKPSDNAIRNLEKAGALIAAEIDRLLRAQAKLSHEAAAQAE